MLIFVKGCQSARTFAFSYGLEDVLRVFSGEGLGFQWVGLWKCLEGVTP
ncbi:hypothetical protein HanIR_Chr16g0797831 [Helianthus annuus]|nr:hypothetical protein HanIR_Chr16g0797831 [Helianthus annuus]